MNWTDDAACALVPEEDKLKFFSEDPLDIVEAQSICGSCPVRELCLETALGRSERFGVWGGASQEDLRRALAVGEDGKVELPKDGPVLCPNHSDGSPDDLYVVKKYKSSTDVACSRCGMHWRTKKIVSKYQSNW